MDDLVYHSIPLVITVKLILCQMKKWNLYLKMPYVYVKYEQTYENVKYCKIQKNLLLCIYLCPIQGKPLVYI